MYKLTNSDGTDFYSGEINYRENIGKIIRLKDFDPPEVGECGRGLHTSRNPNDCFVGIIDLPVAAFQVKNINVIVRSKRKTRSQALKVIREVNPEDLLDWNYKEACNPINPFDLPTIKKPSDKHLELLKKWDTVRNSVESSYGVPCWDEVRYQLGSKSEVPVWNTVWQTVEDSAWCPVWNSVWATVGDKIRIPYEAPVWDSVGAYIGSLFPNIKKWKYVKHEPGIYPFQPAVDLWKQGLLPSKDGGRWRLHSGEKAEIIWGEKKQC